MTSTTKRYLFPRTRQARYWLAGALSLMLLAITLVYHARPPGSPPESDWLQVKPQILENQLGLIGRLEAATRLTLAAPFEGLVHSVSVTEGQRVELGQLLLTLDSSQLEIQLREALAVQLNAQRALEEMQNWPQSADVARARRSVTNAQLSLSDTRNKLTDTRRLFDRGIVARMEVEALEQQARMQTLDLAASQAELSATLEKGKGEHRQIAEMECANAQSRYQALVALHAQRELRAPFAGIILRPRKQDENTTTAIQQGIRATQGMPLFELVSLEQINAVTRVEEADLHQLSEGMRVRITGDGFLGMTLTGKISAISAQRLPSETYGAGASYGVVATLDPLTQAQQQRVRLGMSARLAIVTYHAENAIAIPVAALRRDHEGRTFVRHQPHREQIPQKVFVTTRRAVPQGVEVFGLTPGYIEMPISRNSVPP